MLSICMASSNGMDIDRYGQIGRSILCCIQAVYVEVGRFNSIRDMQRNESVRRVELSYVLLFQEDTASLAAARMSLASSSSHRRAPRAYHLFALTSVGIGQAAGNHGAWHSHIMRNAHRRSDTCCAASRYRGSKPSKHQSRTT